MISPGELMIIGLGPNSQECLGYNWFNGSAEPRTNCSNPRSHFATTKLGGSVFAFGGDKSQHTGEEYDLAEDSWTGLSNLPCNMNFASCCVLDAHVFIASYSSSNVISFDPTAKTYTLLALDLPGNVHKRIAASSKCIYLMTDDICEEINATGQVSNSFGGVPLSYMNKGVS